MPNLVAFMPMPRVTKMISRKLSFWLRLTIVAGIVVLVTGAGLLGYRYYSRPVTLTVAVGSYDGEAANAMTAIASRLVSIDAPVRLKVLNTLTALKAANAFSSGDVDLAVVRSDVGSSSVPWPRVAMQMRWTLLH
jgi:TRAP-type uncharacterized transport system substrate-binding protein